MTKLYFLNKAFNNFVEAARKGRWCACCGTLLNNAEDAFCKGCIE